MCVKHMFDMCGVQEMKRDVEKVLEEQKVKGRRMVIEDVEGSSESEEEEISTHGQGDGSVRNGHTITSSAKVTDQQSATSSKSQKKRRKRKSKQQLKVRPAECGNSSEASVESLNDDADDDYSSSVTATAEKKLSPRLADVKSRNSFGALSQEDDDVLGGDSKVLPGVEQASPVGDSVESTLGSSKFSQQSSDVAVSRLPEQSSTESRLPNDTDEKPVAVSRSTPDLPADVLSLKDKGAQLFKSGQYGAAMDVYTLAIDTLLLCRYFSMCSDNLLLH
jgi:hypothetical protein